ncbi:hypothetical protein CVIRNUC_010002 [Coccomyxa viridis]|uniref:Extracellular protein n=1 Tax=Coccomyxa viridis TaxID=1274662 RepID=A0AAV1IHL9_9CHLO|nr:hypothetical protein CVIRNUC_010002 [Coccomyxa viridis]
MEADRAVARSALFLCTALTVLVTSSAGRDLLQAGSMHCSSMSNIYNCFVGGKQMGSVCINQCTNPHNPLFCQNCEDPRELCAKAVPSFDPETSTIHMGQGTDTESRCPEDSVPAPVSTELQSIGHAAMRGNPFMQQRPNACSTQSYQYDCVVGSGHVGQVCVPLCPGPTDALPCLPCEDVRSNCAWAYPSFRMTSFITHFLNSNEGACF